MAELTQRSTEWRALRCGDVTASRFSDIKKPRSGSEGYPMNNGDEIGLTAFAYLEELLAELFTGKPQDRLGGVAAIQHGNFYEEVHREHAQSILRERFGAELSLPTGDLAYVAHPTEPHVGFSPDYGVGDAAGGEMKCPYDPAKHVAYLRRGRDWFMKEHRDQVYGAMWIKGWDEYYVSSFHPDFPENLQCVLWTVKRKGAALGIGSRESPVTAEAYINRLGSRVLAFRDLLLEEYNRLGGAF